MAQQGKNKGGRVTPKGTRPPAKSPGASNNGPQEATSVSDWKSSARKPVYLDLPSGNKCLAINKGLQVFMQEGVIPNALLPMVEAAISKGQGIPLKKQQEIAGDPEALGQVLQLCDSIVVSCVKSPRILPTPMAWIDDDPETPGHWYVVDVGDEGCVDKAGNPVVRDPELLYVDECEMDDKMFVMNWAMGGVKDAEKFREQYEAHVADISGGEGVEQAPE